MASTFQFCEDNGAALGNPARGTTSTTGISNFNLKNIDDTSTTYSSVPITAGNNSYSKYIWGLWTGSFNQITTVKFNHISGVFGAGLSLFCGISGSGFYNTPATTSASLFTNDITNTGASSVTGLTVLVGSSGPHFSGKAASTVSNPAYSEFIGVQLRTTVAASAGDTVTYVGEISWQEN